MLWDGRRFEPFRASWTGVCQESSLQPCFGLPQICTAFDLKGRFYFAPAEDLALGHTLLKF